MVVKKIDSFSLLRDCWNELLEDANTKTIFQTYEWLSTWWKYFGGRLYLLSAWEDGRIAGIAPLMIEKLRVKGIPLFRMLSFVGRGPSDHMDFILRKGREKEALESFADHLLGDKKYWDLIWLSDIPEDSPTNKFLSGILGQRGLKSFGEEDSICPYIELPSTYEEFKHSLSRNARRNIVKYSNRIDRAGKVEVKRITDKSEISHAMDVFFELHEKRWLRKGNREGPVRSDKFKEFHSEAADKLFDYLNLTFLILNGKYISTMYCYDYDGTQGFYLQGMDMDYANYSPTTLLIANQIEDAIKRGLKHFDFLRGHEPYKYNFTKTHKKNRKYFISHSGAKLRIFLMLEWLSKKL